MFIVEIPMDISQLFTYLPLFFQFFGDFLSTVIFLRVIVNCFVINRLEFNLCFTVSRNA